MAAAGAPQPPNRPPGGPFSNEPLDKLDIDGRRSDEWTKDEKTKTCKCEPCGDRVRFWSYKCAKCSRHVCSECLDHRSTRTEWQKVTAKDRIQNGCWCKWRSNMNPKFRGWKPPPPIRTDEEQKARESKSLVTMKQNTKLFASRKIKDNTPLSGDDGMSQAGSNSPLSTRPDEEYVPARSNLFGAGPSRSKRKRNDQKSNSETRFGDETLEDETYGIDVQRPSKAARSTHLVLNTHHAQNVDQMSVSITETRHEGGNLPSDHPRASIDLADASHLDSGSTVIVGSGFIGLFIARELALQAQKANIKHKITIIDVRESHCELASGHCAGILSSRGVPEEWTPIVETAQQHWQEIVSDNESCKQLGFAKDSVYYVTDSGDFNQHIAPSWLQQSSACSMFEDSRAFGRINPARLSSWLIEQCKSLHVNFRFACGPYGIEFADNATIASVRCEDMKLQQPEIIKCSNVVLAAGPYTTWIFEDLFEKQQLGLENHVQQAHWFRVQTSNMHTEDDVALRFPHATSSVEQFENEVTVVPRKDDMTLVVSAVSQRVHKINLDCNTACTDRSGKTSLLAPAVSKHLNVDGLDVNNKSHVVDRGCSALSIANNGNPIIDKVPASGLGRVCSEEEDRRPFGVWLCYGFGRYGTLLAPGAAQMLVSKMVQGYSEADSHDFSIPTYAKPKPDQEGKGKGKAKMA